MMIPNCMVTHSHFTLLASSSLLVRTSAIDLRDLTRVLSGCFSKAVLASFKAF